MINLYRKQSKYKDTLSKKRLLEIIYAKEKYISKLSEITSVPLEPKSHLPMSQNIIKFLKLHLYNNTYREPKGRYTNRWNIYERGWFQWLHMRLYLILSL